MKPICNSETIQCILCSQKLQYYYYVRCYGRKIGKLGEVSFPCG